MRPKAILAPLALPPQGTAGSEYVGLFYILFDASSKEFLIRYTKDWGLHAFEEIASDISDFFNDDGMLHKSTLEVLPRIGPESFKRVEKIMRFWKDLEFPSEEEGIAWINSASCDAVRRESFFASLLILKLLPITEEGTIVDMWRGDPRHQYERTKASLIQASEWPDEDLEMGK